jgi:large subunit ribosomal protein L3
VLISIAREVEMLGLIGKKVGMTQIFDPNGDLIPVTAVRTGPCHVIQKKAKKKDGYDAIQLGFDEKKRANRPDSGHYAKSQVSPKRILREFRVDSSQFELGQELKVDIFAPGEKVNVTGISKGKGFTGVVKRHGYSGGPETHGSMSHDVPGSIGGSTFPGRVWKGKGLPGRHGGDKIAVKNLQVVEVDSEKNLLYLKGAVPGPRNGYLIIKKKK